MIWYSSARGGNQDPPPSLQHPTKRQIHPNWAFLFIFVCLYSRRFAAYFGSRVFDPFPPPPVSSCSLPRGCGLRSRPQPLKETSRTSDTHKHTNKHTHTSTGHSPAGSETLAQVTRFRSPVPSPEKRADERGFTFSLLCFMDTSTPPPPRRQANRPARTRTYVALGGKKPVGGFREALILKVHTYRPPSFFYVCRPLLNRHA